MLFVLVIIVIEIIFGAIMKKNIIIVLAIFVAAVLVRFGFSMFSAWQTSARMKMGKVPGVTVGEITEEAVIKSFDAPGRIVAVSRIDILARVDGYLTRSFFKEGDFVKKGQVLFEIEPKEWQLAANKAKANLDNTVSQLAYYNKQLVRYEELVKQDFVSKAQYDQILAQRNSYKAQVALNRSAYQDALRNLSYTKVKSPVDGNVGMILVTVGNYVTKNSGALTTVNSVNPIYVTFPIDAKVYSDLVRIDKNANEKRKVDLLYSDGSMYSVSGVCDFHDNNVDQTTGTITMRATFDNSNGELIHGNIAKVRIYSKNKANVATVPETAVMQNAQGKYVYLLDEKDLPQVQFIEVSGTSGKNWIVEKGLKKGDRIVLTGIQGVIPNKPVKILSAEEIAAENAKAEKAALEKQKENSKKD